MLFTVAALSYLFLNVGTEGVVGKNISERWNNSLAASAEGLFEKLEQTFETSLFAAMVEKDSTMRR
ncbi:hypothetical protein OSTOST_11408 [Ostertagia ostertagi]